MKINFRILSGLIFILSCTTTVSNAQQGYILGDSIYDEGKVSFNPKKPYEVSFRKPGSVVSETYNARELKGFGNLTGNTEYVSFEIEYLGGQQLVFLKRASNTGIRLYSLDHQKRLFIYSDELIELQEPSFRYQIARVIEVCSNEALQNLAFNENAIAAFLRYYDKTGKCDVRKDIEFGLLAGYTQSTFRVDKESDYAFVTDGYESRYSGIPVGVHASIPFWPVRGLNWLIQVQYQRHIYQEEFVLANRELDVSLTASSVQFSGSAYYEVGTGKIRPYVYVGPSFLSMFGAESDMLMVLYNTENASYDRAENWYGSSASSVGLNWGIGVRLTKIGKLSISAEYQGSQISFPEHYSILMNNIQIKIGI